MSLLLVRHSEPVADARGRCYGSLDVALSDEGRRQSGLLAAALAGRRVVRVCSSPRVRALETAGAIALPHRLPVDVLDALRELDFGAFEGRTYDEIAAAEPELYERWMREPTRVRFPGGECYDDLRRRALAAVGELRGAAGEGDVVAVTHGGVVRAVVAHLLAVPAERIFRLRVATASVTVVEWLGEEPVVGPVSAAPEELPGAG